MKRLLSVCLLMLCLCVPVFAGHTVAGGYCDCGTPGCICDPGEHILGRTIANVPDRKTGQDAPVDFDLGPETLLVLAALLLVLRYKA